MTFLLKKILRGGIKYIGKDDLVGDDMVSGGIDQFTFYAHYIKCMNTK